MVRAYSSVVEHYVDIVGVASSILATPTIRQKKAPVARGLFLLSWSSPFSRSANGEVARPQGVTEG